MTSQSNTLTRQERCALLVDKILDILGNGISLDPDAMHYIDTTFSHPSAEELEQIFSRESDSESDSAMALVFFPDDLFCEQLEDLLEELGFKKSDEESILAELKSHRIVATIDLPGGRGSFAAAMPPHAARQFVSCLNVSFKIDASLIEAIDGCIEPPLQRLCKVKLRCAKYDQTAEKVSFLRQFFETAKNDEHLFQRFDFILHFLAEVPDDREIFETLMRRKRFYIKNLQRVLALEEQARGKNIETLIQQGIQLPHINKRDVGRKIRWIDEISLAVFGKTDYFGSPGNSVNIAVDAAEHDVGSLSKILS